MKKQILIALALLCAAGLTTQTTKGFFKDDIAQKGTMILGGFGAGYLIYQIVMHRTPVDITHDALDQYIADISFAIKLMEQEEDVGSGYCAKKFDEIKPILLLSKKTITLLESHVKQLEIAFSARDKQNTAQAFRSIKQCIEGECSAELERQAFLRKFNRSYIEKLQHFFAHIGLETRKIILSQHEVTE